YEFRDRASDAEKFFVSASYDTQVTGNLEKARQTIELWAQTYPRDPKPLTFLSAFIHQPLGNFEKSIEDCERAIEVDPEFFPGYLKLAQTYMFVDRLGEAENTIQRAFERKLQNPILHVVRYQIAFLETDQAAMEREAAFGRGNSGLQQWTTEQEALTSAYSG